MSPRYRRRLIVNRFNLVMSLATMAFGMVFLLWILFVLFQNGVAALSPKLFTTPTPPPGSAGGLSNAIFGSIVIVASATLISTPIGILAGIYLAEYGRGGWLARSRPDRGSQFAELLMARVNDEMNHRRRHHQQRLS